MSRRIAPTLRLITKPRSSVGRVLQTVLTNVILAGLTLLTGSLAARILGPSGRGHLAAIQIWPLVIIKIAHLGLPDALVFLVARKPRAAARYTWSATAFGVMTSILVGVAAYWLLPLVLVSQPQGVSDTARLYAAFFFPLVTLMNFPLATLRGLHSFGTWNLLTLAHHLAWLVVLLIARISGEWRFSFIAYGYLLTLPVLAVMNHWVVRRRVGRYRFDASTIPPMLRFGLPSALSNTSEVLNLRVDQVFLALVVEPRFLGLYVAASAWSIASRPILTGVSAVLFPRVAMDLGNVRQFETFAAGIRATVAVASILSVALLVATPFAIPLLFGDAFASAVPAALLLVVGGTLRGLNGVIEDGLRGLELPKLPMKAELLGVAATVALAASLVGRFGIVGVAAGSLVGYIASSIVLIRAVLRHGELPLRRVLAPDFVFLVDSLRLLTRRLITATQAGPP